MTSMKNPEEIAKLMDAEFRFKIGDLVKHRGCPMSAAGRIANGATIVERFIQQCHGGLQAFYDVRCPDGAILKFFDFELEEWSGDRFARDAEINRELNEINLRREKRYDKE